MLAGTPNARPVLTRFEMIERLTGYTVVRCLPAIGRTRGLMQFYLLLDFYVKCGIKGKDLKSMSSEKSPRKPKRTLEAQDHDPD